MIRPAYRFTSTGDVALSDFAVHDIVLDAAQALVTVQSRHVLGATVIALRVAHLVGNVYGREMQGTGKCVLHDCSC